MQIILTLNKDKIRLPIATGETIQGLIYRALSRDLAFSTEVHNEGNIFDKRKYKLMTFGELKGKYKADGQYITYFSKVRLEIRSADDYLIQLLFAFFLENKRVYLGNNEVEVSEVRLVNDKIFNSRVEIRTLSPITAYVTEDDGHTTYYSPDDEEFYTQLRTNAYRKWKSRYGDEEFEFSIRKQEGFPTVKRATRYKDTFITAWHGRFVAEGSAKVLDFLYNVGLGGKNSQGFGMFEITDNTAE